MRTCCAFFDVVERCDFAVFSLEVVFFIGVEVTGMPNDSLVDAHSFDGFEKVVYALTEVEVEFGHRVGCVYVAAGASVPPLRYPPLRL